MALRISSAEIVSSAMALASSSAGVCGGAGRAAGWRTGGAAGQPPAGGLESGGGAPVYALVVDADDQTAEQLGVDLHLEAHGAPVHPLQGRGQPLLLGRRQRNG